MPYFVKNFGYIKKYPRNSNPYETYLIFHQFKNNKISNPDWCEKSRLFLEKYQTNHEERDQILSHK